MLHFYNLPQTVSDVIRSVLLCGAVTGMFASYSGAPPWTPILWSSGLLSCPVFPPRSVLSSMCVYVYVVI